MATRSYRISQKTGKFINEKFLTMSGENAVINNSIKDKILHPEEYFVNVPETQEEEDEYSLLDECDPLNRGFYGSQALFGPDSTNQNDWDELTQFDFDDNEPAIILREPPMPTKFVKRQNNFDHEVQNYLNTDNNDFKKCKLINHLLTCHHGLCHD